MATTPAVAGTASLVDVLQQKQAIIDAAQVGIIGANQFIYVANFDGTNNTLVPTNGDIQNTNVAQLHLQASAASQSNSNIQSGYFAGPGTEGTLTASSWLSPQFNLNGVTI